MGGEKRGEGKKLREERRTRGQGGFNEERGGGESAKGRGGKR